VSEIMARKVSMHGRMMLLCALPGLACADDVAPAPTRISTYQPSERRPVDVLLVVDDSPSMHGHQTSLAANLDSFGQVFLAEQLQLDPRVAVVTTSVLGPTCSGAFARGGEPLTDSCASLPESAFVGPGEFESQDIDYSPLRETRCSLATIERRISPVDEFETDLAMRPWFEAATNSYGGNLAQGLELPDVLVNVGLRGFGGCEFESPLAAARRALDRFRTEGDPAFGFLRTGAPLVIVFIGDEDDCSHPDSSGTIFDPQGERVFWSNPEADAATSAVCHNASTACDAQGCEIVDRDLAGEPTSDPSAAVLDPVDAFAAALADLRAERDVMVAVIGGVGSDGSLAWPAGDPGDPADLAWREEFGWSPGCTGDSGASAQPPGRLHALATIEVAPPGAASICEPDWTPVFGLLGGGPDLLMPWCAPTDIGPVLECELSVRTPTESLPLPACERDGDGWVIDPETGAPRVPDGEDRCWLARDDPGGTTEDVWDDLSPECVEQGSGAEWMLVVRPGTLPLPRGSEYESSCPIAQ
jgi:hypothetical protein